MGFEAELEKWKDTDFGPYCMTKCGTTCCDMRNFSLHVRTDELKGLFSGKIVPEDFDAMGIKKAKTNGMYYLDTDNFCPKFDSKTGKCTDYNRRPASCRAFPLLIEKDAVIIKAGCSLDDGSLEYKKLVYIASVYGKVIVKR
jgi:Fe-S-cluster containining protein